MSDKVLKYSGKTRMELVAMAFGEALKLADLRADEVMTPELAKKDGQAYFKIGLETYKGVLAEWRSANETVKKGNN